MNKEYDLINELGYKNWMDAVAGEAVMIGLLAHQPELEVLGTNLARIIGEIPYNHDDFYKVGAEIKKVEKAISEYKGWIKQAIFIDEICKVDQKGKKSLYDWAYNLLMVERVYRIQMILPVYLGKEVLKEEKKLLAERVVSHFYDDPGFQKYKKVITETDYVTQKMETSSYYDAEDQLLRRVTDHNHEGSNSRGRQETFYFKDFSRATQAWADMKEVVTSDRKR